MENNIVDLKDFKLKKIIEDHKKVVSICRFAKKKLDEVKLSSDHATAIEIDILKDYLTDLTNLSTQQIVELRKLLNGHKR